MKIQYLIIMLIFTSFLSAQKPVQIQSMADESRDSIFYAEQSKLWKQEIKKNKKNVNSWFNYYSAERYSNFYNKNNFLEKGNQILVNMKKASGESYEYLYLMYLQGGNNKDNDDYILKAYKLMPNRTLIYPSLVTYADIVGNDNLKKEVLRKWYKSDSYPAWNYYRTYNVLIGLDENSFIISTGDIDVYGKLLLQENKGLRKDVTVIIQPYLYSDSYYKILLEKLNIKDKFETVNEFKENNNDIEPKDFWNSLYISRINFLMSHFKQSSFYFDIGLQSFLFDNYEDSLYLEGIVYKYSNKEYNNIAIMQRNFENNYLLDYIKFDYINADKYSTQIHSTGSYLSFFLELYDFYNLNGDLNNLKKVEEFLMIIGENIGMKDELIEYIEKN